MIVPMATAPVGDTLIQYFVMQIVTSFILGALVGYALTKTAQKYRHSRFQHNRAGKELVMHNLTLMIVWAGVTFVALSVLVYTVLGPNLALLGDRLGFGYTEPLTVSFNILALGALLFLVAGVIALITRKPSKHEVRNAAKKAAKATVNKGTHEDVDY